MENKLPGCFCRSFELIVPLARNNPDAFCGTVDACRSFQAAHPRYLGNYDRDPCPSRRKAAEWRGTRATLETALLDVQDRITAIVDQISRGLIEDDDVAAIMPKLRKERDRIKAELATTEPTTNVLYLKPLAVDRYRYVIENLTELLQNKMGDLPHEAGAMIREIVTSVTVHPRKPGADYKYEIRGRLSSIAGPELSAVEVVAGGRIELPTSGL